jgi:2-polyprenyl-3-methyl-5-hydroxy-6-metoxy-1,4-benzoquinol methylase
MAEGCRRQRIGVVVVAYNASKTLAEVLDRIPDDIRTGLDSVLVCDDHSQDDTYEVALHYQRSKPELPVVVCRRGVNLGYGGNQKAAYGWAIEHDLDIVVLLHGDGQYAPECMEDLIAPLVADEGDAVFGSRLLKPGAARQGGMPLYKFVGNRILTTLANHLVGLQLSEWHSGYRAYKVAALRAIPYESNSDGFDFDVQLTVQLHEAGLRIVEVPVPTYYGSEICYVNGMQYARDVITDVVRYRLHKIGLGHGDLDFAESSYDLKLQDSSSHTRIVSWLSERPPKKILDLGCSDGALGQLLRSRGHHVTGVDIEEVGGVHEAIDRFLEADLEQGLANQVDSVYEVIVAADVLEHVRRPDVLLTEIAGCLTPDGTLIASVPNFAHWYPRLRVVTGRFDYDRRGILDRTHLRFFTGRSFARLAEDAGFRVVRREAIGVPFEVTGRRGGPDDGVVQHRGRFRRLLDRINLGTVSAWPSLFAYQYVYELAPKRNI